MRNRIKVSASGRSRTLALKRYCGNREFLPLLPFFCYGLLLRLAASGSYSIDSFSSIQPLHGVNIGFVDTDVFSNTCLLEHTVTNII